MEFDIALGERLDRDYPHGTRIRLIEMKDDPYPVPSGMTGTVSGTSAFGFLYVSWDNGSTLNLVYGLDRFEVIHDGESTIYTGGKPHVSTQK